MSALSSERAAPSSQGPSAESLLVFAIGGQEFGLPIGRIVEVAPFRPPTPVPGARRGIMGVLPLRGRIVMVIDGRERVGLGFEPARRPGSIIVLHDGSERVGLAVDAVARVARCAPLDRAELPTRLALAQPDLFQGAVTRGDGGCVLVLDTAVLLRGER